MMSVRKAILAAMIVSTGSGGAEAEPLEGKRTPAEIIAAAADDDWRDVSPDRLAVLELERGGTVIVELSDRFAPRSASQFARLARAGFYDGLSFYRVIDGFVAQAGDAFGEKPLPDGATNPLPAEFERAARPDELAPDIALSDDYADATAFADGVAYGIDREAGAVWPLHCPGVIAFARDDAPDTATSEVYVTLTAQRYLDRNLSVFGRVLEGMDYLQALTRQAPPASAADPLGDAILRVWMGDAPPSGVAAPAMQVLRTEGPLFGAYIDSRKNRPEGFFVHRPDHVNACAAQVPARRRPLSAEGSGDD